MNREAVLENVRRYRGIASLYRQTAAFRPGQSRSLLGQAKDWERRALQELKFYFESTAGTKQHFSDMQLSPSDVRSLGEEETSLLFNSRLAPYGAKRSFLGYRDGIF